MKSISIDILDNDCMAEIFMYLIIEERLKMEQVSEKWNAASHLAWHDINNLDISNDNFIRKHFPTTYPEPSQLDIEKLLSNSGMYLKKLTLKLCDSTIMSIIRDNCNNLVGIELDLTHYKESNFIEAFSNMMNLQSIKIKNCKVIAGTNDTEILKSLPVEIEKISLSSEIKPTYGLQLSQNFGNSLIKFTGLRHLTLANCILVTNVLDVISEKNTLTYLSLAHSRIMEPKSELISNLVNLEYLDLKYTRYISDTLIISVSNNCKNLRHLDISGCNQITKHALNRLQNLKNLNEILLDFVKCVDDTIINQFGNLQILGCAGSWNVTDASIERILHNSPNLQSLCVLKTGVSPGTVRCANNVVKNRENYLKLCLVICRSKHIFRGMGDLSPLLIIK